MRELEKVRMRNLLPFNEVLGKEPSEVYLRLRAQLKELLNETDPRIFERDFQAVKTNYGFFRFVFESAPLEVQIKALEEFLSRAAFSEPEHAKTVVEKLAKKFGLRRG